MRLLVTILIIGFSFTESAFSNQNCSLFFDGPAFTINGKEPEELEIFEIIDGEQKSISVSDLIFPDQTPVTRILLMPPASRNTPATIIKNIDYEKDKFVNRFMAKWENLVQSYQLVLQISPNVDSEALHLDQAYKLYGSLALNRNPDANEQSLTHSQIVDAFFEKDEIERLLTEEFYSRNNINITESDYFHDIGSDSEISLSARIDEEGRLSEINIQDLANGIYELRFELAQKEVPFFSMRSFIFRYRLR